MASQRGSPVSLHSSAGETPRTPNESSILLAYGTFDPPAKTNKAPAFNAGNTIGNRSLVKSQVNRQFSLDLSRILFRRSRTGHGEDELASARAPASSKNSLHTSLTSSVIAVSRGQQNSDFDAGEDKDGGGRKFSITGIVSAVKEKAFKKGAFRRDSGSGRCQISGSGGQDSESQRSSSPDSKDSNVTEELWTDKYDLDLPPSISRDVSELEYLRRTNMEWAEAACLGKKYDPEVGLEVDDYDFENRDENDSCCAEMDEDSSSARSLMSTSTESREDQYSETGESTRVAFSKSPRSVSPMDSLLDVKECVVESIAFKGTLHGEDCEPGPQPEYVTEYSDDEGPPPTSFNHIWFEENVMKRFNLPRIVDLSS